jgi:hypothetical protein
MTQALYAHLNNKRKKICLSELILWHLTKFDSLYFHFLQNILKFLVRFLLFFFAVLRFELRALCLVGKYTTAWAISIALVIFQVGSCFFCLGLSAIPYLCLQFSWDDSCASLCYLSLTFSPGWPWIALQDFASWVSGIVDMSHCSWVDIPSLTQYYLGSCCLTYIYSSVINS